MKNGICLQLFSVRKTETIQQNLTGLFTYQGKMLSFFVDILSIITQFDEFFLWHIKYLLKYHAPNGV